MNSFKMSLSIIQRTLIGHSVPFKILDILSDDNKNPYAKFEIEGERFFIAPTTNGTKVWISDFPIKNTENTNIPPGYIGFPTDVAGVILRYYKENPRGPIQNLTGLGTINLNEIIREEISSVFENYKSEEDTYYNQDIQAEVSTALSFIQDIESSVEKIRTQIELKSTTHEVDSHLEEAVDHLKKAMDFYLETLEPKTKSILINRLGEIKIWIQWT